MPRFAADFPEDCFSSKRALFQRIHARTVSRRLMRTSSAVKARHPHGMLQGEGVHALLVPQEPDARGHSERILSVLRWPHKAALLRVSTHPRGELCGVSGHHLPPLMYRGVQHYLGGKRRGRGDRIAYTHTYIYICIYKRELLLLEPKRSSKYLLLGVSGRKGHGMRPYPCFETLAYRKVW